MEGFGELCTMRPAGMALLPIPSDRMGYLLDENGITDTEDRATFRHLWRELDRHFLKFVAQKDPPPATPPEVKGAKKP